MEINGIVVKGNNVDKNTRCEHYHSERDIIAIKFKCCNTYYPCYQCHDGVADHPPIIWSKDEKSTKAILCGRCGTELTINEYTECNSTCPHCHALFNEGCKTHYHLYFEM